MRVNAGSGKTDRLSDLSDRIRTLGQDIQNFLFGPVRQKFVLRDFGPWIAVASRLRRDAFTGKPESFETSRYTHSFSISDECRLACKRVPLRGLSAEIITA